MDSGKEAGGWGYVGCRRTENKQQYYYKQDGIIMDSQRSMQDGVSWGNLASFFTTERGTSTGKVDNCWSIILRRASAKERISKLCARDRHETSGCSNIMLVKKKTLLRPSPVPSVNTVNENASVKRDCKFPWWSGSVDQHTTTEGHGAEILVEPLLFPGSGCLSDREGGKPHWFHSISFYLPV